MRVSISRFDTEGKITLQESGGLAIVTMHRPSKKNAMTIDMWTELNAIIKKIISNPKNKVVILKGSGGNFSAGSDIEQFSKLSIEEANHAFDTLIQTISSFEKIPLPTIAIIDGPSMGGGFELALSCDLRVGSLDARMGIPVGRLGITLNKDFAKRIMSFIGKGLTLDLVYTGRILKAEEAERLGILNYMVQDQEKLVPYTLQLAEIIMKQSPDSLLAVKRSAAYSSPEIFIPWETKVNTSIYSQDFYEGVRSFVEKREPNFEGRYYDVAIRRD